MKRFMNKKILLLACVVGTVFNLNAQTPISFADLDSPASRPGYSPESVSSQGTAGTIGTEVDDFISVFDWSALKSQKSLFSVGFNESPFTKLNAGLGLNLGKVYLGIAYGGDVLSMPLWFWPDQPFIDKDIKASDNTLNVLVGTGIIGIKLGFSELLAKTDKIETLVAEDQIVESILERSLKPSLEVGANVVFSDKFRLKPAIRLAWDIHHYESESVIDEKALKKKVLKLDYSEPAVGVTVGFDFGFGGTKKLSFDLIADAALRLYDEALDAVDPDTVDLRITGSLPIVFSAALTDRVSFGVKLRTDAEFNALTLVQTGSADAVRQELTLVPTFGAGVRFNLLPEHFAVYGGFELPIFENATLIDHKSIDYETSDGSFEPTWVPNVKLTVGLTVNFTKNTALEMMVNVPVPAGVRDVDSPKFSMSFTVKK